MSTRTISLLVLLLALPCWAANDFSTDPNCVALWRMESGALTTDSIGTNTLIDFGTPDANSTFFKEGAGSVRYGEGGASHHQITDVSKSAGFPLKSTNNDAKCSVCFWFRPLSSASPTFQGLVTQNIASDRSFSLIFDSSNKTVRLDVGHDAGANGTQILTWGTAVTDSNWYWLAATVQQNGANIDCTLYIWDDTNNQVLGGGSQLTGSVTNETWNISNDEFTIGTNNGAVWYLGYVDEVAVFNDVLSLTEIGEIRQGAFGVSGAQIMPTVLTGD